jgi:SsrA-binding protein
MTAIAENRRARHEYAIDEQFEAGMVLSGWEIKAIRAGQVQLTDGYVHIRNGELYLIGCRINALRSASTHVLPEPDRTKKRPSTTSATTSARRIGNAKRAG